MANFGKSMGLRLFLFVIGMPLLAFAGTNAFGTEKNGTRADVEIVRSLYSEFAEEAVIKEPTPQRDILGQPQPVLTRFFTTELSALLLQDRECAVRTQEICDLDFSPMWDSQDPTGATVTIVGRSDLGDVLVTVHYPDNEVRKLVFRLEKKAIGWRIADIVYADGRPSLSQLLKRGH
jgi:hypothetical protein